MTRAVIHQRSAIGHWCLGLGTSNLVLGSGSPASHHRRGVSLLEVLVSIFVLTAGLLGIAAMLPLASLDIIEATKCENAEIVGIRSMGEVTIRELYNPRLWMRYNGEEIVQTENQVTGASSTRPVMLLQDYNSIAIIDPVLIARYPGASGDPRVGGSGQFPLHVPTAPTNKVIGRRYSLRPYSEYSSRMNLSMAERIFLSHDDLDFVEPADENDRPRINMACKATDASSSDVETALPWPFRGWEGDSNYTNPEAMVPLANNHYSWLAVVVPQFVVWQRDFQSGGEDWIYLDTRSPSYQVSVVVYYRRQYEEPGSPLEPATPTERRVTADFQGDGRNGGEVRLVCDSGDPSSYLELRTNDIIMLAQERTINNSVSPPVIQPVVNFYRVVGLDDIDDSSDPAERYATLDGPDWTIDDDGNGDPDDAVAVIIPGVIGVRTAKFNVQ